MYLLDILGVNRSNETFGSFGASLSTLRRLHFVPNKQSDDKKKIKVKQTTPFPSFDRRLLHHGCLSKLAFRVNRSH
jgi:hypothetical protein